MFTSSSNQRKASQMLLLATVFWGVSFPVMKALGMVQQQLLPNASSWFISSSATAVRFGLAALIMLAWSWRSLRQMTRLEIWQGLGLGLFGGAGLLFQMDGLAYTSASTSAFLTQCYCLILPVFVAIRDRRLPSTIVMVCCSMVIAGVAVLSGLNWHTFKLGRGEWESLIGSVIFTAQILWLERPIFAKNRVNHFSLIMFTTMLFFSLPIAIVTSHGGSDWWVAYSSPAVGVFMLILVTLCTMVAYMMMNYWQRHVPATEAGLIYGAEPLFASFFALFLPAWLSALAGLNYANEKLTLHLLVGGGLITIANILVQTRNQKNTRPPSLSGGLAVESSKDLSTSLVR
jgi:drug/metabolite transporter (DMT)-like permease